MMADGGAGAGAEVRRCVWEQVEAFGGLGGYGMVEATSAGEMATRSSKSGP